MEIIVCSNEALKHELLHGCETIPSNVHFTADINEMASGDADAYIDLLFQHDARRIQILQRLLPKTVIINSVSHTLAETGQHFVRINGWPSLLSSASVEAAGEIDKRKNIEKVFSLFGKKIEWLPDEPGFVTPRVISMIIHEAFLAFKEGVGTKEDINTAMKLGTAYPYGPFEWAEKIGIEKVKELLQVLAKQNKRYASHAFNV